MGIRSKMEKAEKATLKRAGLDWQHMRVCELGNQYNHVHKKAAKKVYLSRNVIEHVSIDLNGRDGSISLDLCDPLPEHFVSKFNMVTNYGTSEHVKDQYQVFKNMNDVCCVGGFMFHTLVFPNSWRGHGRYYYPTEFVESLSIQCQYAIDHIEKIKKPKKALILVVYKKSKIGFIGRSDFEKIPIIDTQNMSRVGA